MEINICETKNCVIKVFELDLEKSKNDRKTANDQIFVAFTIIYLRTLFYIGIKSHKKRTWLILKRMTN